MHYIGNSHHEPSYTVELHLTEWFDISKHPDLVPIGKFYVYGNWTNMQRLQYKMKKKAKKLGADVIVVEMPDWRALHQGGAQYYSSNPMHHLNHYYEAIVYIRKSNSLASPNLVNSVR
jgi:DNA modification methylase